jgi:acyl-CoA dehydrogenase
VPLSTPDILAMVGLVAAGVAAIALVYSGQGYWGWVLVAAAGLAWTAPALLVDPLPWFTATGIFVIVGILLGVPRARQVLFSAPLLPLVRRILPKLGETERIAAEAGTVWWDGDLFSGRPRWRNLLNFPVQRLSDDELWFLDVPVQELCGMIDDWAIQQDGDLPPEIWDFLKEHKFFGMIIPKEYGGLGFSALAHSAVITKLASRSAAVAVTAMVPNSLGPAELLLHYGTEDQKRYYLPRLAKGEEIPCFALTGPEAGSDAAATQSEGIVCLRRREGQEILGMRLNWRKRYITLGPVSTLIGLAFRLRDPDGLLQKRQDLGITCALVPSNLPGIEIGQRHDPMGIPFQNGPTQGTDVFVPLDRVIGDRAGIGEGWRMLMESLAAGRSISLPALSVGAAELATRVVGAYATVREQFDTPIGRFEGIEEPLARIGGLTYVMNAARVLTAAAVDAGEKPSVISAIVKAYLTESMRQVLNDAMDIRAGAAICRGPRNILARAYSAVPIGITVEGANILTRSMIIYGQGAIRCHPFANTEIEAAAAGDLARFDRAFFGHIGYTMQCVVRSLWLGLTGARFQFVPGKWPVRKHIRRLTRLSTAFALVSDVCMMTMGSRLKRREKITGRLADALAWLYLGSAAIKRFKDDGYLKSDRPIMRWVAEHATYQVQQALVGVLDNLPNRVVAWGLGWLVFPRGAKARPPSDKLGGQVARGLLEDGDLRRRLSDDIYVPNAEEAGLGRLEAALAKCVDGLAVEAEIRDAIRAGKLDRAPGDTLIERALEAGIIDESDALAIKEAEEARAEAIRVDAFDPS